MRVRLPYGRGHLELDLPDGRVDLLEPRDVPALPDEAAAFRESVRAPIALRPLREIVGPGETVAVVIPDITRPFPSDRVLPWLFEGLGDVAPERVVIVNGTGSHRANTADELDGMVGREIAARYRIVNHDAHAPATHGDAGKSPDGFPIRLNRDYLAADRRIVLGFIEPHFFAGFSGGYKAVFPGVAAIDAIMHYHRAEVVGDPRSTWGILDGNPTQELVRACGSLAPVDFCVNVTLNAEKRITRFFSGDVMAAHEAGCAFVRENAMIRCESRYPVVVTTNGGYPLDQNLYQSVKGMSAAAQIVEPGGLIAIAAECADGFPDHGNFRSLLLDHESPQAILDTVLAPDFSMFDQWEAQKLAMIRMDARVALRSGLPEDEVGRAHMEPAADLGRFVCEELDRRGTADARIAVLPEGPLCVPYVER